MLCIGLDDLAGIKSRHGRFAADAALIHAAKTLSRPIRSTDLLARIGDDEFGLILDHLDHNSAIETAERLACCIAGTRSISAEARSPSRLRSASRRSWRAIPPTTSSPAPPATWRCARAGIRGSCAEKTPLGHVRE